ncbi:MAG: ATP-binding protein [Candidatus Heimdallarchaeota archaeon]|nr:ATP-binding protein [Candidatus Heimdallarchaeota archaeon]
MIDFLKKVTLFSELEEEDYALLEKIVTEKKYEAETILFNEGDTGEHAFIIKEGKVEIIKKSGNKPVLLAIREVGDVIGEMAVLKSIPRTATVRCKTDCCLLVIAKDDFDELIDKYSSVLRSLFKTIINRWTSTEILLRQNEKMAQLGTLSAGLAHELNNPATAIVRSVSQLKTDLEKLMQSNRDIGTLNLSSDHNDKINELKQIIDQKASTIAEIDPLVLSDLEYNIENYLDNLELENAWVYAPVLATLGLSPESLNNYFDSLQIDKDILLKWITLEYQTKNQLVEIEIGSDRISSIVGAFKGYSYMDQAPVQSVDIHEGINNTLIILRSKLKKGIQVERQYDPNLKKIQGHGGELNQVWTNIIHNAIDALEGKGTIKITTKNYDNFIYIEIEDNGPGIPKEIKDKIFDPFFTTKKQGQGTGLGLDITYKIITQKHRGDIKVISSPGFTCFRIILPINFEDAEIDFSSISFHNRIDDSEIRKIFAESKNIAVINISKDQENVSCLKSKFLQSNGYNIYEISTDNPILTQQAYPSFAELPEKADILLLFPNQKEDVIEITKEAINHGVSYIWIQEGFYSDEIELIGEKAGKIVVMDKCIEKAFNQTIDPSI